MVTRTYSAVLNQEGDWIVATCPEIGTTSQGKTQNKALANLKEATEIYLEEFPTPVAGRPFLTTFEAVVGG